MQLQTIIWITERLTVCHPEPQPSISTPNATDPSLRLRVTVRYHNPPSCVKNHHQGLQVIPQLHIQT